MPVADGFLRQVRSGGDGAESMTRSYAHPLSLFLRSCAQPRHYRQAGAGQVGLFMAMAGQVNQSNLLVTKKMTPSVVEMTFSSHF